MKAIWKFPLKITDRQQVEMPIGSMILCVQMQFQTPTLWAICDTQAAKATYIIDIYGTGHPMREEKSRYIGTFQVEGGALVFHAFENQEQAPLPVATHSAPSKTH